MKLGTAANPAPRRTALPHAWRSRSASLVLGPWNNVRTSAKSDRMNAYHLVLANLTLVFLLKLTCFVLGYKVVKLGHRLLEDGVKGEFKFKAQLSGAKADLVSASPGLLFLVVGVFLIGYAIFVPKVIELDMPQVNTPPPPVALPELSLQDLPATSADPTGGQK